jgi:putative ABC transport system permease protein
MLFEYLRIARKILVAHKFRSGLTVLSITIGAFSIVLMSSLAESGLTTLWKGIEELGGGRLVWLISKNVERGEAKHASYTRGITSEDRDLLMARLPHVVEHTWFASPGRRELVSDDGTETRSDLVASDGDFFASMGMEAARGRFFSDEENRRHAKVCVVGARLADELWDGDAVGHTLSIDGTRCKVIGQATPKEYFGMNFDFDWLRFVALPIETLNESDPKIKETAALQLKTDDATQNGIVKRIANQLLVDRHNGVDDFQIFDFSAVMKNFDTMFAIMEMIVGLIAGISLLVGGVGVMNMMLVSVSERVREIGIRKALGASPRDIRWQFLLEAVCLAGTGGAIGVSAGVAMVELASAVIRHFKPSWVTVIGHGAVLAALMVSLGVGALFGWFPARRAARLDPITAIRA